MVANHQHGGTRFRLFPKAYQGYLEPETVWLSPPPGSIGPGPVDRRMHVVDALAKEGPYDPPVWGPPYRGPIGRPALPSRDGHFDHIPLEDRTFLLAHTYASTRRVLDIWEAFFGRRIEWWHVAEYPSMELIPFVHWNNAQSGSGFIEMGARRNEEGVLNLFCLNFEVIAHEVGHAIAFSTAGVPDPERLTADYLAFQESFSDLIALISVSFFDSVINKLLRATHGSLYVLNLLNRIGEISQTQQIRIADNETRLRDLSGLRFDRFSGEWTDATGAGRNAHDLAQPLTGAIFDNLVEIFQDHLAERGVIPPGGDARGWRREEAEAALRWFDRRWGAVFDRFEGEFRAAVIEARDVVGRILARIMDLIDPNDLTFARVASLFLEAALDLGQQHRIAAFRENFLERDIAAELPVRRLRVPIKRGTRLPARPRPACFADQIEAGRRARRLAGLQQASLQGEVRRVRPINRLLRQTHRDAGHLT
ncbi:MAG TPA: hypothetical protein VKW08_13400 [Xanthobacteraceae bacterium]|jgi:hypothetical protein|nr:hypothetical protein [Xanthobacteraceae bacterium]